MAYRPFVDVDRAKAEMIERAWIVKNSIDRALKKGNLADAEMLSRSKYLRSDMLDPERFHRLREIYRKAEEEELILDERLRREMNSLPLNDKAERSIENMTYAQKELLLKELPKVSKRYKQIAKQEGLDGVDITKLVNDAVKKLVDAIKAIPAPVVVAAAGAPRSPTSSPSPSASAIPVPPPLVSIAPPMAPPMAPPLTPKGRPSTAAGDPRRSLLSDIAGTKLKKVEKGAPSQAVSSGSFSIGDVLGAKSKLRPPQTPIKKEPESVGVLSPELIAKLAQRRSYIKEEPDSEEDWEDEIAPPARARPPTRAKPDPDVVSLIPHGPRKDTPIVSKEKAFEILSRNFSPEASMSKLWDAVKEAGLGGKGGRGLKKEWVQEWKTASKGMAPPVAASASSGPIHGKGLKSYRGKIPFGNYVIDGKKLKKNILSISYPSGLKVKGYPNARISDNLKKVFNNQKVNSKRIVLTDGEKRFLAGLIARSDAEVSGSKRKVVGNACGCGGTCDSCDDEIEALKDRLNILAGELDAQNDSPEIKREMGDILTKLVQRNRINRQQAADFMKTYVINV